MTGLPVDAAKPRRRDYEKILSGLQARWKRRPADRAKIMQEIVNALWSSFGGKVVSGCCFYFVASDSPSAILGPHQGNIPASNGNAQDICKRAAAERRTQLISDGHTEIDPSRRMEIAIPAADSRGEVFAALALCSARNVVFSDEDRRWLERLLRILRQASPEFPS